MLKKIVFTALLLISISSVTSDSSETSEDKPMSTVPLHWFIIFILVISLILFGMVKLIDTIQGDTVMISFRKLMLITYSTLGVNILLLLGFLVEVG